MAVLSRLASFSPNQTTGVVVVTSARALMHPTMPVEQFRQGTRTLRLGELLDLDRTIRRWAGLGYDRVSVVEGPGQFSHRGGILDIFPPAEPFPVRMELFGDQVESIRRFDPATQRSETQLEAVTVTPAREPLPRRGPDVAEELAPWFESDHPPEVADKVATQQEALAAGAPFPDLEFYLPYFYRHLSSLADYLPPDGLLVVDEPGELADNWAELEEVALEVRDGEERERRLPPGYPIPYLTWDDWREGLADRPLLILGHGERQSEGDLEACFRPAPRYGGRLREVLTDVEKALLGGEQVVIVSRQAHRLTELWEEGHGLVLPVENLREPPGAARSDLGELSRSAERSRQAPIFVRGPLDGGWVLWRVDPGADLPPLRLLTDAEIFGWRMPEPRRPVRRRRPAPESIYADLTPGDAVVHVDYGIGIFRGLVNYTLGGEEREYLLVEYAGRDSLYVPVYQADRLSRYVGTDDRPPKLSSLGTADWDQVKARTRRAVEEVAQELLELYAAREIAKGHAFSPDTPWQAKLEAGFPHLETPDQAEAIGEVKQDMEQLRPMDRLVCGDAGYGKTEVALRAAFKAVMGGKQVALLVPTTVLAQQHYTTFHHRLDSFPVRVEMLSRFRTRAEQSRVLEGLRGGEVDIAIGTHRLLQRDVVFRDLGLVIIDEEQRFGVTHKERLKKMRTEVDVLTMTATPIPRTLYLSLTGVRDISVIETPPEERLPISTYVGRYDAQLVRRAILRELKRSGQVFYVHNRVQTIEGVCQRMGRLVPEATIGVAHGQMRERELEQVMLRFVAGEVDVLLCTSIIESGLDIPNANTLIVEQAERFGMAQLYQLRGRVGRGARRAYAYFFYNAGRLSPEARQRLETIREASESGAGYSIAMRDLEMRGAGEILGTRQSGHISAVGFNLYTRLLARAVEEMRAEREGHPPPPEPLSSIRLDLPLPIGLPPTYVPDTNLRLQLYRRLANLSDLGQIEEIEKELADRFGPLPELARNLMLQLRLKVMAREAGVKSILVEKDQLVLRADWLEEADQAQLTRQMGELAHLGRRKVRLSVEEGWQERLRRVLRTLRRQG
jgi:transcription-repair coupling factor (superfamily II helicase)